MFEAIDLVLLTTEAFEAPVAPGPIVANLLHEDRLLADALVELGIRTKRVAWSRTDVPWTDAPAAIFRTTWDYFERWPAFSSWFERVAPQTQLLNAPSLVRWNLDKHYLADLAARAIPIVPTRFVDRGSSVSLSDAARALEADEIVVKPAISGAGRDTVRLARSQFASAERAFAEHVATRDMLVQPFVPSILERGEVTLILFDGRFSHAICKRAAPGEFRVQDDHGGTVHDHDATADEVALAEAAFAACHSLPTYGRVDMVRAADGSLQVMELELVEPELWLRNHPDAAQRFARAIAGALDGNGR